MTVDPNILVPTITSMLVITSPFDPVKILIFNRAISDPERSRTISAAKVALYVIIILGGTALIGRQFLELVGIDLNAFSIVGGLVILLMGFEMLYGGGTSKAQGDSKRQRGPESGDALFIPLTLPLIAGPGAMTTTITLAARSEVANTVVITLIAVGVVALSAFVSYVWFGGAIAKLKPAVVAVLARIGGLLLATIGAQMMLNGFKLFFA